MVNTWEGVGCRLKIGANILTVENFDDNAGDWNESGLPPRTVVIEQKTPHGGEATMKVTMTAAGRPYICTTAGARCKLRPAKTVCQEVAGVDGHRFTSLPTALWNEVTSLFGLALSGLCEKFDEAYKSGPDIALLELLQDIVPGAAYELGRRLMEALLRQQTGFYRSKIQCHECSGRLSFHGYVGRNAKTKMGLIRFARAHYKGDCGYSAYPMDVCLGLDGEHGVAALHD